MDSTLDFVTRARHAWQEFRSPSQADVLERQAHANEKHERRESVWPGDPSEQNHDERTPLEQFRLLVGIHQHKSFSPPHGFRANRRPQLSVDNRPSPNLGIYSTVCDSEIKSKRSYKFCSRLINCCLGLQIIVAAALTALGAANGSRSAVTVFGAINTVIAGFLTYLKGSGLPNRLKYYQHEWAKVREYIEQRERDFSFGLLTKDYVMGEISQVREMYEAVRADIETNTPDRFVGTNRSHMNAAQLAASQHLRKPEASFSTDSLKDMKGWLQQLNLGEKQNEANAAVSKAQHSAHGLLGQARGIKDMLEHKIHDLGQMEKEIESSGRAMVDERKRGIAAKVDNTVGEVAQLGQVVETQAKSAMSEKAAMIHEKEQEARGMVMTTSDAARSAIAQQRSDAEQAITGTSKVAGAAIARQRQDAEDAIHHTSDVARDAVNQQRQVVASAIAPVPPPSHEPR